MNRKEFLGQIGLGAAFVLTASCLGSCTKENFAPTGSVDFTLDLTDSQNSALLQDGGYIVVDNVVVARTTSGDYVAATRICSHEGSRQIIFRNNEWYCTDHGARFDLNGGGLNRDGSKGLYIYQVERSGDMLRVFN